MKFFGDRHGITYPMLGDPQSQTIRDYGVFNHEATGMQRGFARPGYFLIDRNGIIKEKFFEAKYRERQTGNSIIAKLFPELAQEVTQTVEAPHLRLVLEQSDSIAVPGTRLSLVAEVHLPADVHVYAPGSQGYKPVKLVMDDSAPLELKAAAYPQPKSLYMPAIKETVSVFEKDFRITQDLQISTTSDFWGSLGKDGKVFTLAGKLEYQACDKTTCFPPNSIPVQWQIKVLPLDRTRAPIAIRHK